MPLKSPSRRPHYLFIFWTLVFALSLSGIGCAAPQEELQPTAPQEKLQPTIFKFSFGTETPSPGTVAIAPDTLYSSERGYGFEPGATLTANNHSLSSSKPFLFSVALPEGNYNVALTVGNPDADSVTTVKAESRRLMLQDVQTTHGQFTTRNFTVNIRNARLKSGRRVGLKEREKNVFHWDDKLTLEFNGTNPSVSALEITPAPDATTVYIAGDSTVTDQPHEPWAGWGQMLPAFFKSGVAVANYAESGETLRAFAGERRLEKIQDNLKKGDYLFIQFGHNDMKEKGEGVGAFTTYSESLRQYIAAARKNDATPVLVTPMERRRFGADGSPDPTLGDYPEAVRRIAKEENVPLIDLNIMSTAFYRAMGPDNSTKAFVHYAANTFPGQTTALKDNTHFNTYGAFQLAKSVVEGIKKNLPDLAIHLTDEAQKPYDPAKPDPVAEWHLPPSPDAEVQKPDGN
ncbi:rhamnogalacturonan acetylesterase RhgT [Abditibacteriota bacterium]|nr:rhamnogalacturonan acetylesterase RhgT [Abditibacteriota bacterium]